MTAYGRNFVPGGCFFFTVNLAQRRLALLTDHVEALRAAFRETRQRHPFTIDAIIICDALAADQVQLFARPGAQ